MIKFQPRAVKAIKLRGIYGSGTNHDWLFVVELEAYCVPPPAEPAPNGPNE